MKGSVVLAAALAVTPLFVHAKDDRLVARGRYLVEIGGCNDCHTPGYAPTGGKVPESQWLIGDRLGWHGPWGTSYPANLRLLFQDLTEEQWLKKAKTFVTRPPMPWFDVRAMSTTDLKALYRYIHQLGPAGEPAPKALGPGEPPPQPYVDFPAPPK
jgi:mono/diheme cytochrome c family protein